MMTKFLNYGVLCVISLLLSGTLAATEINFMQVNTAADWEQVTSKAQQDGLPIFVDVYTDWCGYCKMMDREVFSDREVGDYFNTNFISVKLDAETSFGEGFAALYEVSGYPTYLFLDEQESLLGNISGYSEKAEFLGQTRTLMATANRLPQLQAGYEAGSLSKSERMEYAGLIAESDPAAAEEIASELMGSLSPAEMLDPAHLPFMAAFTTSTTDPVFVYIKEHTAEFKAAHGQEGLDGVMSTVYSTLLQQAIGEEDEQMLASVLDEVLPFYVDAPGDLPKAQYTTNKMYYAYSENWTGYIQTVEDFYQSGNADEQDFWYRAAYEIIDEYNYEQAMMTTAFAWLDKALQEVADFETYYLYSYGLGIAGEYEQAKERALQAKASARNDDQVAAAEEVLSLIAEAEEE